MATTKASKADKAADAAAAEAEQDALVETLGSLEIHPGTGVALDTEDPNYEQLKRLEDLKTEIKQNKLDAVDAGVKADDEVQSAALDAEEAKLRAILAQAQNAAAGVKAPSQVVQDLAAQKAAAEAAQKAANGTDGK